MTLRLEINGIDFTSFWRPYESNWTMRAWNGESSVSSFVIDDDGSISHANLAARKIVEVWENATGSDVCLYRGRVSNKHLGMSNVQVHNDMRWTVEAEDCNIELRGIRVNNAVRDTETDEVRFEAIRVALLNGAASTHPEARDSTVMENTYLGQGVAVNLEAETYTDTEPIGVFNRIIEISGRTYFVTLADDGTMELYYGDYTDESYKTDIEITDADTTADDIDIYSSYRSPDAGEHGGQNVLTGMALRWGEGNLLEMSDVGGAEAVYDKWEETFTNEWVQHTTQADNIINKTVGLADEDFTYLATIDMQPQHVHRIRAGMMVLLTRYRANKPTQGYVRVVQMQTTPMVLEDGGTPIYQVTMDLGRAQGRRLIPRGRHKPNHGPTQPTADACTRLYFSTAGAGINPSASAVWDTDSAIGTYEDNLLKTTADGTYSGSTQSTASAGGSGNDIRLSEHMFAMDGALAVVIAAGGAHVRMQARARSRYGVGISEAAQDNISQLVIRVFDSGGSLRGTAYAGHSLSDSTGSAKWPAQATRVNRVFPPAAASDVLTAVSGTVTGDYLVVEAGYRSFTVGTTGGAVAFTNDSATDLPEDELETAADNAWIEICTDGASGDTPSDIGDQGEGNPGTPGDDSDCFALCDHVHAHGLLADDDTHMHDLDQISGYSVLVRAVRSDTSPTVNDDEDDGYQNGDIWTDSGSGDAWLLIDGTPGAAVWEQFIPASGASTTSFVSIAKWGTD